MPISIRPVLRTQFPEWLRLREAVYSGIDRAFHEAEMEIYFSAPDKTCLLAVDDGDRVFGMVEISLRNVVDGCLSSPVGYLEGIYLEPEYRGRGLARRLIDAAEEWCRGQGCREIATDAELDNESAQQFHERLGFTETYRIVEYRKPL